MSGRISEAASEKPKRGRPAALDETFLREIGTFHPDTKTRRGKQNHAYCARAVRILLHEPCFPWFLDLATDVCKTSILVELGRITDDARLLESASEISKRQLTSRGAQALIRQWRGRTRRRNEADSLRSAIVKCINDYIGLRQCSWDDVTKAVAGAMQDVNAAAKKKSK